MSQGTGELIVILFASKRPASKSVKSMQAVQTYGFDT